MAAIVVDHGLHAESAAVAATVADRLRTLPPFAALESVEVVRVRVGTAGGPEAAAREARYAALEDWAEPSDAVVLLGHTRDDQAETVLLGLARGSGLRSLAGMAPGGGALPPSAARDPASPDRAGLPSPRRTGVAGPRQRRTSGSPGSGYGGRCSRCSRPSSGPGVEAALARTAEQAATDADTLDAWAADLFARTWT